MHCPRIYPQEETPSQVSRRIQEMQDLTQRRPRRAFEKFCASASHTAWQTCRDSSAPLPMPPPARRNGCVATTSARIRANDVDKSLATLRDSLNALQSASVSSVETKSTVSDWPLPKIAGSAGCGSYRRSSQSVTPGESEGGPLPPGKRPKPTCLPAQPAPDAWHQQGKEFQRSAVLVNFPCGQNNTTIEKFCANAYPDTDPASY